MVAYPDRGAGNDPEPFLFRGGSLSQPRLDIFTVGNMGVMICLGQGGLRSLSASSCYMRLLHRNYKHLNKTFVEQRPSDNFPFDSHLKIQNLYAWQFLFNVNDCLLEYYP